MSESLDLALGPASIFSSVKTVDISALVQKPNDKFIVIPADEYASKVRTSVDKTKIPVIYKKYLRELVDHESDKDNRKVLTETLENNKKELSEKDIEKYFGEVLGPVHLINKSKSSYDSVVFPVRTNYQLFDFFMKKGDNYIGYSSKTGGGVSNTLTPTVISERIKRSKVKTSDREILFGRDVMVALGERSIVEGLFVVAGMIVKGKKFPKSMTAPVRKAMSEVDWGKIAVAFQSKRANTIDKIGAGKIGSIETFMSSYIIPRTRMPDSTKKAYVMGKKKYTGNNVAYGLGMFIVDANKEGEFDCSPFLRLLFNDLNVIKLDLLNGVPTWKIKNLEEYTEAKFSFRSKYRWDVVKDKLGIAI